MDAETLQRVLELLAGARNNLRVCQDAVAQAQAAVWRLEQLAQEMATRKGGR